MTFICSIGIASRDTFLVQSFLNEDSWNGDSHPSVAWRPFQPFSSLGQNKHNDKVFIPLSEWSILILFFHIPVIIIIHISVPVSPQKRPKNASRVRARWQSVTAICQASGSFTSPPFFKIIDKIFLRPCYTRFFYTMAHDRKVLERKISYAGTKHQNSTKFWVEMVLSAFCYCNSHPSFSVPAAN